VCVHSSSACVSCVMLLLCQCLQCQSAVQQLRACFFSLCLLHDVYVQVCACTLAGVVRRLTIDTLAATLILFCRCCCCS
jgi:hypothetical protein